MNNSLSEAASPFTVHRTDSTSQFGPSSDFVNHRCLFLGVTFATVAKNAGYGCASSSLMSARHPSAPCVFCLAFFVMHQTSNQSLQPTARWRCVAMSILISLFSVGGQASLPERWLSSVSLGQFHFFEIGGHGEFAIGDRIELHSSNRCGGFVRAVLLCREPSPDGQAG